MNSCLLCHSESTAPFFEDDSHRFQRCSHCGSVYRDPDTFLSPSEEKARYLAHNNDVNDPEYQDFVSPITRAVQRHFTIKSEGLDYGAGTGPVIAKVLGDLGYSIKLYDPFFHMDEKVLDSVYDFAVCCEVIEHFHRPLTEFQRLSGLLKPGGRVFCMTEPLPKEHFDEWYYKNDPTHVIFYNHSNLDWIVKNADFDYVRTDGRLIELGV